MHRSYEEIRETVHERILSGIDYSVELADEEILRLIDEETMRCAEEEQLTLSQMRTLRQEVFYSIRKLDVLQELVDDPGITEIMINGTENIFIERNGKTTRYARRFTSRQKLEDVIQQVVAGCNRVVNESSPIVDARLENGARVNVVMAPVAPLARLPVELF